MLRFMYIEGRYLPTKRTENIFSLLSKDNGDSTAVLPTVTYSSTFDLKSDSKGLAFSGIYLIFSFRDTEDTIFF